jgi:hypothetical protein
MKKMKLLGIGNDGNFNYYIFNKDKKTITLLGKIIKKFFDIQWESKEGYHNKKDEWILVPKKMSELKDNHQQVGSKGEVRVDVFYGDKKMFLIVHCLESQRLSFNNNLLNFFQMPKPKMHKKKIK